MMCSKCGSNNSSCLCPCSFGFGVGMAFAISMAVFAWAAWFWGYGSDLVVQYSAIYYGYEASFIGGLWGALWGFVEGFIFGFIIVLFYNLCMCCKAKCCGKSKME